MKLCRYLGGEGEVRQGKVVGDQVFTLDGGTDGPGQVDTLVGTLKTVHLLPSVQASKICCVGRNFRALLAEQRRETPQHPFIFLKAPNAVVGPGDAVEYPAGASDVAHEGELAVVIGETAKNLRADNAMAAIAGYTCANDVTVRDWQLSSEQWWRAKSHDTHCPIGPWLETELNNPHDVNVRTYVNGELRQDCNTADMVFDIPQLLEFITAHMTLVRGDVVLTGTGAGIRSVYVGDVMRVEVDGIGELENVVISAEQTTYQIGG